MSSELKPPIFLIGNVRSGTSMLQGLFGLNPDVVTWFEPRTIWTYAAPGRKHDRFDATDADEKTIAYIRKRFLKFQVGNQNRRIVEKTPSNVLRIPYIQRIFPEAKFIYVIREPFAQISSSEIRWRRPNPVLRSWSETARRFRNMKAWRRLTETPTTQLHHYLRSVAVEIFRMRVLGRKYISTWGVRYPGIQNDLNEMHIWKVIAKQWLYAAEQADQDFRQIDPDSVLSFKYEDLVASPTEYFKRLCEYGDLEFTSAQLAEVSQIVDSGRQFKWKRIDKSVLEEITELLREPAKKFGYDLQIDFHSETGESDCVEVFDPQHPLHSKT